MYYDLDQIRSHYRKLIARQPSDYYERFDQYMLDKRPIVRDKLEKAFAEMFPEKVERLLDIGCGTCFYFPLLAKHAEQLNGVDLCIPMLEQAEDLIKTKGLTNCSVQESSALALPFEDNCMDVVHSWDFLHHVPDVPLAISEIHRVLKPGGRYIAMEPNILNPSIAWYHARRRAEWRLYTQNQFTIVGKLRKHFDVRIRYDNTIISFLNERTHWLWKLVNAFTSIPGLSRFSFRYNVDCIRKS